MKRYPKRLIEVDLPIKRISEHARREKAIRHGHISTLHVWWARRPLAACRAVVCASLWPDPSDDICPPRFLDFAKKLMRYWGESCLQRCSADSYPRFNKIARTPECLDDAEELRKALLDFIADFANWDNASDTRYLAVARTLTVAAHDAFVDTSAFCLPKTISVESLNQAIKDAPRPLLADPFAGGGAIPLEGLRCGADVFASDLNPIAVLLNKVLLEYIPKYGTKLSNTLQKYGGLVKEQAEKQLSEYYPIGPDGSIPIAFLWARTITCEGPGCGTTIPLLGNLWLSKKAANRAAFRVKTDGPGKPIVLQIIHNPSPKLVSDGFTAGNSATCPACGYTTPVKNVRTSLAARNGGSSDSRLCAVVYYDVSLGMKNFREPSKSDLEALERVNIKLLEFEHSRINNLPAIPHEPCPPYGALGYRIQKYGMTKWRNIYAPRQLLSLCVMSRAINNIKINKDIKGCDASDFQQAIRTLLALCLGRMNDRFCTLCRWRPDGNYLEAANGAQNKMPMLLDYGEANPFAGSSGDWEENINWIAKVIDNIAPYLSHGGSTARSPAQELPLPEDCVNLMFTDPPYYDAFGYSDLSDFFHIWLRRSVPSEIYDYTEDRTPKNLEAISIGMDLEDGRGLKNDSSYTLAMRTSFDRSRAIVRPDGLGVVVFANKTTTGWEAILESLIQSNWTATASWPIDTELATRQRALGSSALNSSVHIVCRPREDEDGNIVEQIGDWRDILSELPGRIGAWLPCLASEGVVGADAIFACLGPALEIFSRYSSVEKASGERVMLREYLEQVWAEVARQALNMIFEGADASGFEEDARLTAMWLWTLRTDANGNGKEDEKITSLPGYTLEYDAARKIAQGLGCHLENLGHLVEVRGDSAMLLSTESRAQYLFGKGDIRATAKGPSKNDGSVQQDLFSLLGLAGEDESAAERAELERPSAGKTVLDQLHQSMLLFAAGRGAALKRFLVDDGIGANPQFWTLAQAFSALYPSQTTEKRWVDGVLARKKGLGF